MCRYHTLARSLTVAWCFMPQKGEQKGSAAVSVTSQHYADQNIISWASIGENDPLFRGAHHRRVRTMVWYGMALVAFRLQNNGGRKSVGYVATARWT